MSLLPFPSGLWLGFSTVHGEEKPMRLWLGFYPGGRVRGSGTDHLGRFKVHGRYYPEEDKLYFTKLYICETEIVLGGMRDGGQVYGRWQQRSWASGGFIIWPQGSDGEEEEDVIPTPPAQVQGRPVLVEA